MLSQNNLMFAKQYYNLSRNTKILAKLNFNSFANFGQSMTNNGALESWHQGEFMFGCLSMYQGAKHYKNNNLVQGKQTVDKSTYQLYIKSSLSLI